jgi:phospho-N-acetylmuramoyl-pentapeptide-transferase
MKNIRTPLHDHVRKNLPEEKRWSDTQVTGRFLLIQIIISAVTAGLLL